MGRPEDRKKGPDTEPDRGPEKRPDTAWTLWTGQRTGHGTGQWTVDWTWTTGSSSRHRVDIRAEEDRIVDQLLAWNAKDTEDTKQDKGSANGWTGQWIGCGRPGSGPDIDRTEDRKKAPTLDRKGTGKRTGHCWTLWTGQRTGQGTGQYRPDGGPDMDRIGDRKKDWTGQLKSPPS